MHRSVALPLAVCLCLLAAGCLSGLPGATGPRGPPEPDHSPGAATPDVTVADIDTEESPNGTLRVVAVVRNGGEVAATRTVVATLTRDGERHRRSTEVSVAAGGRATVTLDFDLPFDEFGGSSLSVDVR